MLVRLRKSSWAASVLIAVCLLAGTLQAETVDGPAGPSLGPSLCGLAGSWADRVFGEGDPLQVSGGWWPAAAPPFSFVYDGKTLTTLLPSWQRTAEKQQQPDGTHYVTTWLDAKTGLKAVATATVFKDFPAIDWVLRFENTGTRDTPILEKVQALDIALDTRRQGGGGPRSNPRRRLQPRSLPADGAPLECRRDRLALAPVGGRSSEPHFPFFNLQCGEGGFFTAIGWTGQWAAEINARSDGAVRLQAGMELTHLRLRPGRGHPHAPHHAPALVGRPHRRP